MQTSTLVESIEVAQARAPWKLPESVFKPRVKEADSRGFFDTDQSEARMFERDWERACTKEKFTGGGVYNFRGLGFRDRERAGAREKFICGV